MPSCIGCGNEIGCYGDELCSNCEDNVKQADAIYALRYAYENLVEILDCGDNSCQYKKKNEHGVYGMRTNGGCNCLGMKSLRGGQRRALQILLDRVKKLLEL